jgi:hypothetical protein
MSETHELRLLTDDIDRTRTRLLLHRRLLDDQLLRIGKAELAEPLLTSAEELSVDHAFQQLVGLLPTPNWLSATSEKNIRGLLGEIVDESSTLDHLIGARENILTRQQPGRQRVYSWFGRDFVIDVQKQTLTFVDGTALPESIAFVRVEPTSAPAPEPDPPAPRRRMRM